MAVLVTGSASYIGATWCSNLWMRARRLWFSTACPRGAADGIHFARHGTVYTRFSLSRPPL
jgi:UDP-glucose 4-epimerase